MRPIQLFPLFSAIGCLARPLISFGEIHSPFTPTIRRVSQFPLGTWVENIAVRPNGHLLVTLTSAAEIYEIDPFSVTSTDHTRPAFSFDGYSNITGITEIETDIFVACVDSRYIWKLDFSIGNTPQASLVTMIPDAQLLNGVATLNSAKGIVVIADSSAGCIWRVDINTGEYEVILKDATMHPEPILGLKLGINGLKVLGNTIYYTNTPKKLFCRVQVDPISARATSPIEVISDTIEADDFAITSSGVAYLASIYQNAITKVSPGGRSEIVTMSLNSSSIHNPTSAAFGRTMVDANVLYITSGGGSATSINGSFVEGGAVANPPGLVPGESATDGQYLIELFRNKTFNPRDLAALVGAHTVGQQYFVDPSRAGQSLDSSPGVWDVRFYRDFSLSNPPQGVFRLPSDEALSRSDGTSSRFEAFTVSLQTTPPPN
ncbi:hypothetical protein CNMCM6457_007494 [Aspergillus fumigatiaffinis]|nr:hypothetical protein CNMCM6457_007494 [Aspergillus fumigatiaffinis]